MIKILQMQEGYKGKKNNMSFVIENYLSFSFLFATIYIDFMLISSCFWEKNNKTTTSIRINT